MADDTRKHRVRAAIDWARRIHWIWTLFPASGKAIVIGAVVGGIGFALALIRRVNLAQAWLYLIAGVCIYAISWLLIQGIGRVAWPGMSLLGRTRSLIKNLSRFVDENDGNVTAIHYLYDARFRTQVDKLFSELSAEEVCDIVEGDWVINPQVQTARNIRENIIDRLRGCAERLKAKQSAPQSELVGEIESGKFTVRGDSVSDGKRIYSTNLCVKLRVTNKEKIETTLKRAKAMMTIAGETYRGTKTSLWYPEHGKDFLERITDKTPIRHAVATVGFLEFTIEGLRCPQRGVYADVTVILIDEFDVPHSIRNRDLWIEA